MLEKDDLKAIASLLDEKIQPIENRLSKLQDLTLSNTQRISLIEYNTDTTKSKVENIQDDIKDIKFQLDTVYQWVDKIDLSNKEVRKTVGLG